MNRLREVRTAAGLTQQQLAERVGTTQQQIQRIEAGQDARLAMALELCGALNVALPAIFPGTKAAWQKLTRGGKKREVARSAFGDHAQELGDAGVDVDDGGMWSVLLRLSNGAEVWYPVSRPTVERLKTILDDADDDHRSLVQFQDDRGLVFVDASCVDHAWFADTLDMRDPEKEEREPLALRFYYEGSPTPFDVLSPPDDPVPDSIPRFLEDGNPTDEWLEASGERPINGFLSDLVAGWASTLKDIDGGEHLIRTSRVLLAEIPFEALGEVETKDAPEASAPAPKTEPTAASAGAGIRPAKPDLN